MNQRPLRPQRSAHTKLSYTPTQRLFYIRITAFVKALTCCSSPFQELLTGRLIIRLLAIPMHDLYYVPFRIRAYTAVKVPTPTVMNELSHGLSALLQ